MLLLKHLQYQHNHVQHPASGSAFSHSTAVNFPFDDVLMMDAYRRGGSKLPFLCGKMDGDGGTKLPRHRLPIKNVTETSEPLGVRQMENAPPGLAHAAHPVGKRPASCSTAEWGMGERDRMSRSIRAGECRCAVYAAAARSNSSNI